MTLTSVIVTISGDEGDLVCPICGAHVTDWTDIFARCHRCGSEVTIGEAIGIQSELGRCCPEFDCLYTSWDQKQCRACGADCSDCPVKKGDDHDR